MADVVLSVFVTPEGRVWCSGVHPLTMTREEALQRMRDFLAVVLRQRSQYAREN
jgi:hypothetical protein